jgi:putative transposase
MALKSHYFTKFEFGKFYHVYNRVVNKKRLFKENRNYDFFKSRMKKYIFPYADVYSYCLLRNHFHLLIKIKDSATLKELSTVELPTVELPTVELPTVELPTIESPTTEVLSINRAHHIISSAFRKMFQSYAMSFNKQENRIGTLFQEPFKRSLIDSEECLKQMIYYIHFDPQKHELITDFREYRHSTYMEYVSYSQEFGVRERLNELFGSCSEFLEFHNKSHNSPKIRYIIE